MDSVIYTVSIIRRRAVTEKAMTVFLFGEEIADISSSLVEEVRNVMDRQEVREAIIDAVESLILLVVFLPIVSILEKMDF